MITSIVGMQDPILPMTATDKVNAPLAPYTAGEPLLKNFATRLSLALLSASVLVLGISATAFAQSSFDARSRSGDGVSETVAAPDYSIFAAGGTASEKSHVAPARRTQLKPFSRIAVGVGVSPLGVGFEVATNINRHFNIRGTGNFFNYTDDGITTEGFNVTAKANFASAGASLDYYPFHKGFRLSPGVLFYNQNKVDVVFRAQPGTSFTLDDHTYYSASGTQAVVGNGTFGLGNGQAAFTATTGWGNVIPASGRHLTFPVEIGVAFIKKPTAVLNLTGFVCDSNGQNCVNVETDPTAQADLAAQVKSYANDIDQLKTYPIVKFGVSYNFRIR